MRMMKVTGELAQASQKHIIRTGKFIRTCRVKNYELSEFRYRALDISVSFPVAHRSPNSAYLMIFTRHNRAFFK